jgi:brefeldin A-inhibited guanine nucleotide-exchange protein
LHENLKNLSLTNVGQLIGDIDEFAGQIRKHYIGQMNFYKLPLDEAMRVMLKNFTLPGESQVVERIIDTFGVTYFEQNKEDTPYVNSDAVYSFSYLLMMLQSNLHNPQVIEKMTLLQFSKLSKGMNGSPDAEFAPDFLETVYNSIQRKPLGVHEKLKEI